MAPTTNQSRLGELKYKQETVHGEAIATPSTYWAASPKQQRVFDLDTSGLEKGAEDDQGMQTNAMADPKRILLAKLMAPIQFKTYLPGVSASTPAQDPIGLLLKAAMGGESVGGATTTIATGGGAGATVPIKVAAATGMVAGSALRILGEARRIVSISGVDITLDHDLVGTPADGSTVYQAITTYLDESALTDLADAARLAFAVLVRGAHAEDQYQALGCFPTFDLVDICKPSTTPKIQWGLHPIDWDLVTGVAVGASFTETNPAAQVASGLYMRAQGTVTRNPVHTANLDIKMGLELEKHESPTGQEGVLGYTWGGGRTTLEFDTYFDSEWNVGYEAGTAYYAGVQLGTSALITLPTLYIDKTPVRDRATSGPARVKVSMHADNGLVTTNELTKSRVAIHRFGP